MRNYCISSGNVIKSRMVKDNEKSNDQTVASFCLLLKKYKKEDYQMKSNIVLIGMPGVGKSTIGVILAKILGYHFLDSDLVIQEREKRLLHQIITEEGTEGFLKIENDVNASLDVERTIIATGGSAIYGKEAMEHLKEIGEIVYLKADYPTIRKRLGNLEKRGVALKNGQTLKDLYDERTALYEKYADITVDEKGLGTEETIGAVLRGLNLLNEF